MSTDMEATETVRRLQLDSPAATALLQVAVRKALAPATAARPQEEEEYYYDSDDSVLDIDEQYPELAKRVMQWQAAQWDAASVPPWHCGISLTLARNSDYSVTICPTCARP